MKGLTYLAIDLGCLIIPFLASFYAPHSFAKKWKAFFFANFFVALFFILWDWLFTEMGVWGFNPDYLTGIYIANLPLEEVLFFICIPYACTFTYFALEYLLPNFKSKSFSSVALFGTIGLVFLSILLGNNGGLYTQTTAFFLVLFLIFLRIQKINLSHYYLAYFLILPFFFISNGLLTGSCLDEPIVWYNDQENLGVRIFTIPIEDAFYGMLLIFMNIYGFDFFRRRFNK